MLRHVSSRDIAWQHASIAYFAGLDLGQAQDYTALAILERQGFSRETFTYTCRHLQRWQLRTSFQTIVADTARMMNSREMHQGDKQPTLAVDATGLGAPVVDLFKAERMAATLEPIQITGGSDVTNDNGVTRVPKRDLVSTAQVFLQSDRLKIVPTLPDAQTLTRELQNFQVKITDNAHDTYGAWREGTHDDLVLAVALALWCGNRPANTVHVFRR
jgi:hypothetical protein